MDLPLEGITILDASRVLAGPFCTMILSDLGAKVIKIEDPENGDETRHYGPFIDGKSLYFMSINRNKELVKINLKDQNDREKFIDLYRKSDVFVHNFTPQTEKRLGVSYEDLKVYNEKIIYVSISGYGRNGPYAGLPAYDIIIQGESGLMSVTGCDENSLTRVGNSTSDIYTGYICAISILAYLLRKEKKGMGETIDISLLDSTVYSLTYLIPSYSARNENPKPMGIAHPGIVPYQKFRVKDGDVIIAIANDRIWERFCKLMNIDDETMRKYNKNEIRVEKREEVVNIVQRKIENLTVQEVIEKLKKNGIPAGKINKIGDVISNEHILATNAIIKRKIMNREINFASFPITINGRRINFYRKDPPI